MRRFHIQFLVLLPVFLLILLCACKSPPPAATTYAEVRTISAKTDTGIERGPQLIPNKFEYDVIVPYTTKTVTLNAILARTNTTVNYKPSKEIPIQAGQDIEAHVIAIVPGASTSTDYKLNIISANLDIESISLTSGSIDISPPVIKNGLTYNIEVPGYIENATLAVTPQDPNASVRYQPSATVQLRENATTTIKATVTDKTGKASQVYTFNLKRPVVREVYVKSDGNDANVGTSKKEPLKTLGKAFAAASRMGLNTIVVIGTLTEESERTTDVIRDNASVFTARSVGNREVTLRGEDNGRLSAAGIPKRVLKLESNAKVRLESITITGGYLGSGEGAAVYVDKGSSLNISKGASLNGNRSSGLGAGGVYVEPRGFVTMSGGTITKNTGDGIYVNHDGDIDIQSGIISVNDGRGIYLGPNSTFTFKDGLITENNSPQSGSGVYLGKNAQMTMTGGTISSNISAASGGGIYSDGGNLTFTAGTINNNTAANEHSGGGIFLANAALNMNGGRVLRNHAGYEGGGIYLVDSSLNLRNGTISENTSNVAGGGVYLDSVQGTINDSEISKNVSSGSGGGVYLDGSCNITMNGSSRIINNEAALASGGLFVYSGIFNMNGGTIDSNKAPQGAGIYVEDVFNLAGGTISNNQGKTGGGIFIKSREPSYISHVKGNLVMTGGAISGNRSSQNGGGVYIDKGVFDHSAGTVEKNAAANGSGVYVKGGSYILSGRARVANGNNVFLGKKQFLTVGGTLQNSPVANLEIENGVREADLLLSDPDDGGNFVATNYAKFTVNGQPGMINQGGIYIP